MNPTLTTLREQLKDAGWSAVSGTELDAEGRMLAAEEKLSEN